LRPSHEFNRAAEIDDLAAQHEFHAAALLRGKPLKS
jgi:hypothetical protein